MEIRILKYKLDFVKVSEYKGYLEATIHTPLGFKHLSVKYQGNDIVVWGEAEEYYVQTTDRFAKKYILVGTGWKFDNQGLEYMTTLIDTNGFVWHIYSE